MTDNTDGVRQYPKEVIVDTGPGYVTLTGNQIVKARLLALRMGLNLEAKGMKMSRGVSCLAIVKREFGFRGNRAKVLTQLEKVIEAMPNTP